MSDHAPFTCLASVVVLVVCAAVHVVLIGRARDKLQTDLDNLKAHNDKISRESSERLEELQRKQLALQEIHAETTKLACRPSDVINKIGKIAYEAY